MKHFCITLLCLCGVAWNTCIQCDCCVDLNVRIDSSVAFTIWYACVNGYGKRDRVQRPSLGVTSAAQME